MHDKNSRAYEREEIEIILERLLEYIGVGIIWILGHCNKLKYILKYLEKQQKFF